MNSAVRARFNVSASLNGGRFYLCRDCDTLIRRDDIDERIGPVCVPCQQMRYQGAVPRDYKAPSAPTPEAKAENT